jgi:hypothetical protein
MTSAEFKARYPAFAALDDVFVQSVIDEQALFLDAERWGELYSKGQGLLTAHELTLSQSQQATTVSGLSDDKTQKKAGDVSWARDSALLSRYAESPYMRTTYGQQYLYLMHQVGQGIAAI